MSDYLFTRRFLKTLAIIFAVGFLGGYAYFSFFVPPAPPRGSPIPQADVPEDIIGGETEEPIEEQEPDPVLEVDQLLDEEIEELEEEVPSIAQEPIYYVGIYEGEIAIFADETYASEPVLKTGVEEWQITPVDLDKILAGEVYGTQAELLRLMEGLDN